MKILPLCLLLSLTSCAAVQSATAPLVRDVQVACASAGPVFAVASQLPNTTAQGLGQSGAALCQQAAGGITTNIDSNSVTWLGTVAQDILPLIPVAMSLM